jgi:hypothetical protein
VALAALINGPEETARLKAAAHKPGQDRLNEQHIPEARLTK